MQCHRIKMNSFFLICVLSDQRRVFYWILKGWITPAIYANLCDIFSVKFWLKCLSFHLEKIKILGLYLLFSPMEASIVYSNLQLFLKNVAL